VKNWEIEASYKTNYKEWCTVDHNKYTFAVNGGPATSGEKDHPQDVRILAIPT
jgi:hypothetical protein